MFKIISIVKKNYLLVVALTSVFLGLILTTNNALTIYAETISAGVLKIEYSGNGVLFNEEDIYPGYDITKTVTVTNQGSLPHSFSIAVDETLGSLTDVLVIEPQVLGTPVWTKTVSEIKKSPDSDVIVGSISPGGVVDVNMRAYLPESVGNEYMGTSTFSFDFVMGNESTDEKELGDGGEETVVYSEAESATITGSSSGRIFSEDIGGEEAKEDEALSTIEDSKSSGEALGAEIEDLLICYWWWVLLIIFAIFLIIYGYVFWDKNRVMVWFWPIFVAIVLYLIHWILHDYYRPSEMCPYFVLFESVGLVLYGGGVSMAKLKFKDNK